MKAFLIMAISGNSVGKMIKEGIASAVRARGQIRIYRVETDDALQARNANRR